MRMLTGNETTALKVADKLLGLRKVTQHTPSATEDLYRMYADTHRMGHQLKCRYHVGLSLYNRNGLLAKKMKDDGLLAFFLNGADGELSTGLRLRATDVEWPMCSADTESVKAGSKNLVRITSTPVSEFSVTFSDTKDSMMVRAFDAISSFMFDGSGLMHPPAEYALRLDIGMNNGDFTVVEWSYLVALTNISLSASAKDINSVMEIPAQFVQLDPFLRF